MTEEDNYHLKEVCAELVKQPMAIRLATYSVTHWRLAHYARVDKDAIVR